MSPSVTSPFRLVLSREWGYSYRYNYKLTRGFSYGQQRYNPWFLTKHPHIVFWPIGLVAAKECLKSWLVQHKQTSFPFRKSTCRISRFSQIIFQVIVCDFSEVQTDHPYIRWSESTKAKCCWLSYRFHGCFWNMIPNTSLADGSF